MKNFILALSTLLAGSSALAMTCTINGARVSYPASQNLGDGYALTLKLDAQKGSVGTIIATIDGPKSTASVELRPNVEFVLKHGDAKKGQNVLKCVP